MAEALGKKKTSALEKVPRCQKAPPRRGLLYVH